MTEIKINIKPVKVGDPEIIVYEISIQREGNGEIPSVWPETLGSKELTEAFLTGVKAAFSFTEVGFVEIPAIPV
ncbi:MAG: hypothetical protein WBC21_01560 [Minisyncoccales bacterium]